MPSTDRRELRKEKGQVGHRHQREYRYKPYALRYFLLVLILGTAFIVILKETLLDFSPSQFLIAVFILFIGLAVAVWLGFRREYKERHGDFRAGGMGMTRKIILPKRVRIFMRFGEGSLLNQTGRVYDESKEVTIGEPCVMFYDHRQQVAVPVMDAAEKEGLFLLVHEIGLPELIN